MSISVSILNPPQTNNNREQNAIAFARKLARLLDLKKGIIWRISRSAASPNALTEMSFLEQGKKMFAREKCGLGEPFFKTTIHDQPPIRESAVFLTRPDVIARF
ncbi:MAG: hypothetical protein D6728_07115 [Cyanobacteria bacterium J055]|nr:MAG: hypothetical protein D6728_07115 [Cyanobacteria bacterium J055]